MREQKRSRRIAMSADQLDAFLAAERTCRVATAGPGGPHVAPLWFVWDSTQLWLYSLTRSRRWTDLAGDPRVAVVVDAGAAYFELRGAEIIGTAEPVGEIPRSGEPHLELDAVEERFRVKYGTIVHDGRHGWLQVTPDAIVSWDFRKLADV